MEPTAAPVGIDGVPAVPHGRTALRLEWKFLPPDVRALIEARLGSPVTSAASQTAGFTPGFASVITGEDGSRLFVKAASRAAQTEIASSYAEEARKRQLLGDDVPAPRLEWISDDQTWVVLGFEAVESRQPRRPWRPAELDRALDLAEEIAASTASPPAELALQPLYVDLPPLLTGWTGVPDTWPHHDEVADLALGLRDLPDAQHFVHADLRDDNILLTPDGHALACDWNWPALGPRWQDTVDLLLTAHGDGLDADSYLAERALTQDVTPDHIDAWLAAICGFMLFARNRPAPTSSPHLRTHTDWYAEAAWSWLAQRRGWQV
jgi:hypothetical protein